MAHAATPSAGIDAPAVPTIALGQLLPWALLFGLVAVIALFFLSADQGAISIPAGNAIHEWVHDGRHLLGYPCH